MKSKKLLDSMNLLDDKYIEEANPQNKRKKKRINWIKFGALAACICLMVTALNLFLFIPFKTTVPDVSQYENSEYFPIIEKLNALSAVKPKYKNNFDKIISSLSAVGGAFAPPTDNNVDFDGGILEDAVNGVAPPTSSPDINDSSSDEEYNEITDNQVEGVIEGDIIKRSDKHIYYLSGGILKTYSIEGESSKMVGLLNLSYIQVTNEYGKQEDLDLYSYNCEMYLSKDCKTITIIGLDGKNTKVIALNAENPRTLTLKNYICIEGNYKTSRMVDGKLLVVTNKYFNKIDYSKEETFVPSISYNNETETMLVPMDNIIMPDNITSQNHTVITLLDESTLGIKGCASFLSFSDDIYVTNNAIYASNSLNEDISDTVSIKSKRVTEIACISYDDNGFDVKGSIKVDGYIKDRYSLDEYKGILRVVTTTQASIRKYYSFSGNESVVVDNTSGTSANLYCIDLATWKVISSVEEFAPKGETVCSVRFDKDYAYVCTAVQIQLTDPVFFFDLSDVNNITYKETGTIEGFSTSLINLGNGYLLGIGRGDSWSSVKVEVYKESESKVVSVCSYEIENAGYSENYKSYYVNRDMQMFGFGYCDYSISYKSGERNSYVLLMFANGELLELVNTPIDTHPNNMRSVYIDGYIYIFGGQDFKVIKI